MAGLPESAAGKGQMLQALYAVVASLKLAGDTALRSTAITVGTALGNELDAALPPLATPVS